MSEELAVVPIPHAEPVAVVLWGSNEPNAMVARMSIVASTLAEAIRARGLSVRIGPKEYVRVEGWALCGAILGIFPKTTALEEMRDDDGLFGFRATVELTTRDGGVIGGAMALCTRYESAWADRDANQIASMAQTRAIAKSYRGSLGFVMEMAGYAATPAEEMDGIIDPPPRAQPRQGRAGAANQPRPAQEATERRNGVAAPPEPLENAGALMQYGKYHHNLTGLDIARLFGLTMTGQIPPYVQEKFMGNFDRAAEAMEQAILDREAQGDA